LFYSEIYFGINADNNRAGRYLLLLLLLLTINTIHNNDTPTVMRPRRVLLITSKSIEIDKVTKIKRIIKTSIADSRKSFMRLVPTTNDLYIQIQSEIDNCYSMKTTLQPLICIVGDDYITAKQYFVYYFNTYYTLPNIVKAVDVCFKIIHVFNLKYPMESVLVWPFIQKCLYSIDSENDVKSSSQ